MERSDRQGRRVLTNLGDELDTMPAAVNNAPNVRRYQPRPQPPQPPQPAVQPISEAQLDALSRAMNRETFSDGKLRVLESGASQQYFLVPQVLKVIQIHVDQLGTGVVRECVAVAGAFPTVRCDLECTSDAAGREDQGFALEDAEAAVLALVGEAADDAVAVL